MEKKYTWVDVFRIAVPIFVEQILRSLMGTVNTFMLSKVSDSASAAVGVASQVLNVVIIASFMMSSGTAIIENQLLGAGKNREAGKIMMNTYAITAVLGLIVSVLTMTFAREMIGFMGLSPELTPDGTVYLRILGASCLFQFISSMTSTHFRCHGSTTIPMAVVIITNIVNLAGSWLVVTGKTPVGGVEGIAYVRLIAETVGLVILLAVFMRQKWEQRAVDLVRIDWKAVFEIFKVGVMCSMEGICYMLAQMVTTRFVTGFSTDVLSAKIYTQTINNYPYIAGICIGQAAQIIAGHYIGARKLDEAQVFIRKAFFAVLTFNLVGGITCRLFCDQLMGIFTESEAIKAIARPLFTIDIITCIARSMNHSYVFGLRGAGFVFWPMVIAAAGIWVLDVGLGYVCITALGMGVVGLWVGQAADEWFRGLLGAWQWEKKFWHKTLPDIDSMGEE
ncbi:MAG: MATE family efflux transporter [Oscillospiraceae bacterium]|nr:MATE family efflux transporter [Oscillospiraceae bacterium]